jgi:hypothetical protein
MRPRSSTSGTPLVGFRSKTPTAGAPGKGSRRKSHGELDGFRHHQANSRSQPRRHLRLQLMGLRCRRRWLFLVPPHHDPEPEDMARDACLSRC